MNISAPNRRAGRYFLASLVVVLAGATGCASQQAATAAKTSQLNQTAAQACSGARSIVQQVLQMRTDQITPAQYSQALAFAARLRTLANATRNSAVKERLEYDADAAQTLAAAVRAGDMTAALGAKGVLAGFDRACPMSNPAVP